MAVSPYNRLNPMTTFRPKTRPKPGMRRIEIYLRTDNRVIIVGAADSAYIYWLSETDVRDTETTREIYDYIYDYDYVSLTTLSASASAVGLTYDGIRELYHASLERSNDPGVLWRTPFGHYYGTDQKQYNGTFFANDLAALPAKLRSQCRAREADGLYVAVLQRYLDVLSAPVKDPVKAYVDAKPLMDIIAAEKYLRFSEREEVQSLYLAIYRKCGELYSGFMNAVR